MDSTWVQICLQPMGWFVYLDWPILKVAPMVTVIIAGIIALFLIGSGAYFIYKYLRIRKEFKALKLPQHSNKGITSQDVDQKVSPLFEAVPDLNEIWEEFYETTVEDTAPNDEARRYNTIQAEHFFTPTALFQGLDGWPQAMPGVFTTIGLLGTFLALLLGLSELHVNPVTQQVQGIEQFINALSGKFLSSVVGLVAALVFMFADKVCLHKLESHRKKLVNGLNRLFPRKPPEQVLLELLKESRQQTTAINRLADDLGKRIQASVTDSIGPEIGKMLSAIDTLNTSSQTLQAINVDAVNAICQLPQQMGTVVNEQLCGMLNPRLDETMGTVREMRDKLGDMAHQNTDALKEALQSMAGSFKGSLTDAAGAEMQVLATNLSQAANLLQGMENKQQAQDQQLQAILQQVSQGLERQQSQFGQHAEQLNQVMNSMVERLAGSSESSLQAFQQQMGQLMSQTSQWTDGLRQQFNQMTQEHSQSSANERNLMGEQVASLAKDLHAVVDSLQTAHRSQAEGMASATQNMTNQFTQAQNQILEGTSGQMQTLANGIASATQNMVEGTTGQMQALQQSVTEAMQRLHDMNEVREQRLEQAWKTISDQQSILSQALGQSGSQLNSSLEGYRNVLVEQGRLHEALTPATNNLQSVSQQAEQSTRSLAQGQQAFISSLDRVQMMMNEVQRMQDTYKTLEPQLGGILEDIQKNLIQYRETVDGTLSNSISSFNSAFTEAVKNVGSMTTNLEGSVENMTETLESLESLFKKVQV